MSSGVRILIVDNEPTIRNMLRMNLESEKYIIEEAVDGKSGIARAGDFHPNLIILDLGLPDMSGLKVLEKVRKWTRVPTIILSVTDNEQTKVKLLDAGADDYLTKPVRPKELLARVRVALRNVGLIEATPVFSSGQLEIDLSNKKVLVAGNEVKLTSTEYEVLSKLVRDHRKVIPHLQIFKEIWGSVAEDEVHYVRIYISHLRKKLEANPSQPKHIVTEPGVGYRLV